MRFSLQWLLAIVTVSGLVFGSWSMGRYSAQRELAATQSERDRAMQLVWLANDQAVGLVRLREENDLLKQQLAECQAEDHSSDSD